MPASEFAAPRRSLLRKYVASFVAVVGIPLVGYTVVGVWFSAVEHRNALVELQRSNAETAAFRITQFVKEIEGQLRWATHFSWSQSSAEQHRIDALRLLRQVPSITDLTLLDGDGRERVFVSRMSMERSGTLADRSTEPAFRTAIAAGVYHGPVYFRRGTEPFMTIAMAGNRRDAGVVLAEVNLKTTRDVVSGVRVGRGGKAYVVDRSGQLIAHPDASLVLRNTDLSPVMALIDARPQESLHRVEGGSGLHDEPMLLAQAPAPPLDWRVLVELPVREADEPLWRALTRSLWITAASLAAALAFAVASSWRMVRPIRALIAGAARIGAGQLDYRIEINSGDELEQLGRQFNAMAGTLEQSYSSLERRVDERTRALSEANRAKSRFLAAASHDLRQPLHALNLLVAQLRTEQAAAERERLTLQIERAVGSINGLFDGLLDISKLDAGVVSAEVSAFPVQEVLDRIESTFTADVAAKGLRFQIRQSTAWVHSDPVLLERIAGNLVGNALRYTRRGGIVVGCRRRGEQLYIEVWDSGIGIPADKHAEIFAEFHQLAPTGTLRGEGLGLGLAIVSRLCVLLGHSVTLASWPGRGSRFTLHVPQATPQASAPATAQPPNSINDPLLACRVLVLDNDPGVLESSSGLLRAWGCTVVAAQSMQQAIDSLGDVPPDLMLSDVHLDGGEDGIAVIQALRQRYEATFPALVVSGDVSQATRDRVTAHGLTLLDKPVAPMRLRTLATRLLLRA